MKNLEDTEVRGLSIKRLASYVIAIITFIVALVYRDVRRENQLEDCRNKIETMTKQLEAADKDRAAIKIFDNNQNDRLTKIETKLDFLINDKK